MICAIDDQRGRSGGFWSRGHGSCRLTALGVGLDPRAELAWRSPWSRRLKTQGEPASEDGAAEGQSRQAGKKPLGEERRQARNKQATDGAPDQRRCRLPERPAKTVTPPTMTSADLDRLIAQYLTKNGPKVEPATLTTDVEFVRRIYFDVIGRPPTPDAGSSRSCATAPKTSAPG